MAQLVDLRPVPTVQSLVQRCNAVNALSDISYSFGFHELVVVHAHANDVYNRGTNVKASVMPDATYNVVANTLNVKVTQAMQKLPQNLPTLTSAELDCIKTQCDAAWSKKKPLVNDAVYNALALEITKRSGDISTAIADAKVNPFVCANWSHTLLFDVIHSLNSSFDKGNTLLENKIYDIILKEITLRIPLQHKLLFPQFSGAIPLPAHWTYPVSAVDEIELDRNSLEFAQVSTLLKASLPTASVQFIKRIQNYGLYRLFQFKKHTMALNSANLKIQRNSPDLVETRALFHGCGNQYGVDEIKKFGFYRQYCPNGAIGDGCYYALNASYSNNPPYVFQLPNGTRQLFLVNVAVGVSQPGFCGLKALPATCESVNDGPVHMYSIFDHFQAYPEYVINYTV